MKTFLSICILFITCTINGQNFQGKAIYKTSSKSNIKFGENQKGVTDKMQEELQKRLQKMNQKTFILEFDKFTSTYKEDAKLNGPKPQLGKNTFNVISIGGSNNGSVYYKNTKGNRFVNQTEIMGKRFLVKDKLPSYNWNLSSETKNIGTYTCYKATHTKEVEKIKMIMKNGESFEEKTKQKLVVTAWYTTIIPVTNGPKNYQGLPGLILEINDGKTTIVCTEIILNSTEKIIIQEPKKGKVVSLKKYTEIQKQKTKELMEKMKSRNGIDFGNGRTVKIGG